MPAYISIPSISLTTDYNTEGSASSKITDAWVYINDDLVGVYELPAKFPLLKEGNVSVKVFAGIRDNGISASRVRYLMYDPHVENVNLIVGDTAEITASVAYNSAVNFVWLEDFEGASISFDRVADSDTAIFKQSVVLKEGISSGQVFLNDGMNFFEATSDPFNSNLLIGNTYLELDFKTNENVIIGVYLDDEQFAHITLNPTEDWKKIYLNLKDVINSKTNTSLIKIFIGLKEGSGITFNTSNPQVYIDNIKLVHS